MEKLEETDEFLDINDLPELSQDKQYIMTQTPSWNKSNEISQQQQKSSGSQMDLSQNYTSSNKNFSNNNSSKN